MNDLRQIHADRNTGGTPRRHVGGIVPGLAGALMLSLSIAAGAESATGRVDFADRYHLDFGVSGEVAPPGVRPGDRVEAGAVLLRLKQAPFLADLEAAAAEMTWKQALLDEANRARDRDNELYEEGSLSQVELDLSGIRHLQAESEYRRSAANHAASESRLRRSRITAPVTGIVLEVNARPGDRVNLESASRPALVFGSAVTVVRARVAPGAAVPPVGTTVALVAGDHATSGRVQSVLPAADGEGLEMVVEGGDALPPAGGRVEVSY